MIYVSENNLKEIANLVQFNFVACPCDPIFQNAKVEH